MKTSALLARFGAFAILLFVFGVTVYRAKVQSIAHDEALSFEWFLDGGVSSLLKWATPNHVLFTYGAKFFVKVFGVSEFTLRAPSVIGTAVYLIAAYLLCRKLFGLGITMLFAVAMLSLNPNIMDFMPAARGFILGLACLMAAMYFMAELAERGYFDPQDAVWGKKAELASVFLTLSVISLLANIFPLTALGITFSAVALSGSAALRQSAAKTVRAFARCFVVPGAAVGAFILWPYMIQMRPGQFNIALHSESATLRDLFTTSFLYKWTEDIYAPSLGAVAPLPWSWQARVSDLGVYLLLPGLFCLVAFVVFLAWRYPDESRRSQMMQLQIFGGAAVLCVLLTVALHVTLKVDYPYARYCLYIVPLFTIAGVLAAREVSSRWRWPILIGAGLRGAGVLIGAAIVFVYAQSLNAKFFRYNAYDVISLDLYRAIEKDARAHGVKSARVGGTWWFEPEINFYRVRYQARWLQPYDIKDRSYFWETPNPLKPPDYAYFVFIPASDPRLTGPSVRSIFHDDKTQVTIIAIEHDRN
jgi:uncharacterized membrane protein